MNKNRISIFTILVSILLLIGCSQKKVPITLIWEMGGNEADKRAYDATFELINNTKKPLEANWTIYFNHHQATLVECDSSIQIEQICATYYKMYPTEHFQALNQGDTLQFTYKCLGTIIKTSYGPRGAYIVFNDDEGNEKKPQDIDLIVKLFDREEQWTRLYTDELPYPYGEMMYEQNAAFKHQNLEPTDIFPSPKNVQKSDGNFEFTKNINIQVEDDIFKTEADFLKDKLAQNYNCRFADNASTDIIFNLLDVDSDLNNELDAYEIDLSENAINIYAANNAGAFYAAQTIMQMLGTNELPYSFSNTNIQDYADIAHRGLMLDIARNFQQKEDIMKLIELLASYKMNVFHLHLTDDEGWRIEIPGLEELTEIGSRRGHTLDESKCLYPAYGGGWDMNDLTSNNNGYLTKDDFIEILKFADKHHIKVIPEVDFPGHGRAAIKSMLVRYHKYIASDPAKATEYLLSDFDDESVYKSAQSYTDNAICVAMPSVYTFIEKVVDEIDAMYAAANLKIDIFHIGGDEVPWGAWRKSPICQEFMLENDMTDIRELRDYFVQQVYHILQKKDIQLAGWQELALMPDKSPNPFFKDANLLSYCWNTMPSRSDDEIPYKLANANYPIILSNVSNFYLDMAYSKHPEEPGAIWALFLTEVNSFDMLPYNLYKSVRKDLKGELRDIEKDIAEKEKLNPEQKGLIKGIQGQLWAETIYNFDMVEYSLFPKMYGLIERAWNAMPNWEFDDSSYEKELNLYLNKIYNQELKRLSTKQVNFRIEQAGIKLIDGFLYANSLYPDAEIRYTTDGSEPTQNSTLWTEPVACDSKNVKAKVFYLGKESVTSRLE